jgi:hypothetical protein
MPPLGDALCALLSHVKSSCLLHFQRNIALSEKYYKRLGKKHGWALRNTPRVKSTGKRKHTSINERN